MKTSFTVQGAEKYSNPMKEALGPKLGHLFGKSTCHHLRSLKVLDAQSCLTLCDPMDCSPPGSSVRGILQARTLEWVAVPSSGVLPNPRIEPTSPALRADSLPSKPRVSRGIHIPAILNALGELLEIFFLQRLIAK